MTNKKTSGCYRLLHTADWHLGKMLNDQSRDEEHEQFLEWLLLAVKKHEVDAIVLAGDVFDSANPPQSAPIRPVPILQLCIGAFPPRKLRFRGCRWQSRLVSAIRGS